MKSYAAVWGIAVCLGCLAGSVPQSVRADDFSIGHQFEDGEIVSADVFNEMFGYVERAARTVTTDDMLGTWTCTNFVLNGELKDAQDTVDSDGLYAYKSLEVTVTKQPDGTYQWSSATYNPFSRVAGRYEDRTEDYRGSLRVFHNVLFFDFGADVWGAGAVQMYKLSPSRLLLTNTAQGFEPGKTVWMVCDQPCTVPVKPTQLKATGVGYAVTLSWQDNSTNEIGYVIYRKDSRNRQWIKVAAPAANTTGWEDVVPYSGKFWYRVYATNQVGTSAGSNVAKATIE